MQAEAFTAEMIRTAAQGLSGQAIARLYDRAENFEERYGSEGFDTWKRSLAARLESLSAALSVGETKIFADDLVWFRGMTTSRGIPTEDLEQAIDCVEETLGEQLPPGASQAVAPYFEAARHALSQGLGETRGLEADSPAQHLFDLALVGDLRGARRYLAELHVEKQFSMERCIVDAILPAAREAGRRWHLGEMGVAVEHVTTSTIRSALHALASTTPPPAPNGKAAFVAAVPGDAHDTGLIALALLLEQDGWRVALAGADTPVDEIDSAAEGYDCDVIALSATLASQRATVIHYLKHRTGSIPVLIGGAAILDEADARRFGAGGYASSLAAGVETARRLAGLGDESPT